ncbi:3-keto-5-aminohexanoate cleavage protein [soil metagenome]
MIIQAALNGARKRDYNRAVPHLLEEVSEDATAAIAAGANEFHAHVYADVDRESLEPAAVENWVSAIRSAAPGAFVGISTGAWIENNDARLLEYISRWTVLPDHASVNLSEVGALDVIRALHARGVGIEAGLSTVSDAIRLRNSGLAPLVLRMLVEVDFQDLDLAMDEADKIITVLNALPSPKPILMHGFDDTTWPFVERAIAENYSIRIGLEDTNVLPAGPKTARNNIELIRAAVFWVKRSRGEFGGGYSTNSLRRSSS